MTQVVAIVCYYLGIDALFYWLNRKTKRIVMFHNVLKDDLWRSGVANGVSSSASVFTKTIEECSKRFGFSLDLEDPKTLTITFDDGYANQYTTAYPILRQKNITAYLFCCGVCLEGKRGAIVDWLTHWIDEVPPGDYDLGRYGQFSVTEQNRAEVWEHILWPAFLTSGESFGKAVLDACDAAYPIEKILKKLPPEYVRERLYGVTRAQCDELRACGWRVGWHTEHHFPLSKLPREVAKAEMTPPQEMADIVFGFPYGEDVSVTHREIALAQELHYPCAVSATHCSKNNTSRYFMPRLALSSNKYLLHFVLSGCKFALQHRKLLPRGK